MKHVISIFFLSALILSGLNASAKEGRSVLIVSIDREGVKNEDSAIYAAAQKLNHYESGSEQCFVKTEMVEFVDYRDFGDVGTYYGVAILDIKWRCDRYARDYLTRIHNDPAYTLFANPGIGPWPAISGSN